MWLGGEEGGRGGFTKHIHIGSELGTSIIFLAYTQEPQNDKRIAPKKTSAYAKTNNQSLLFFSFSPDVEFMP
jgi:hypothetical protein